MYGRCVKVSNQTCLEKLIITNDDRWFSISLVVFKKRCLVKISSTIITWMGFLTSGVLCCKRPERRSTLFLTTLVRGYATYKCNKIESLACPQLSRAVELFEYTVLWCEKLRSKTTDGRRAHKIISLAEKMDEQGRRDSYFYMLFTYPLYTYIRYLHTYQILQQYNSVCFRTFSM